MAGKKPSNTSQTQKHCREELVVKTWQHCLLYVSKPVSMTFHVFLLCFNCRNCRKQPLSPRTVRTLQRRSVDSWGIRAVPTAKARQPMCQNQRSAFLRGFVSQGVGSCKESFPTKRIIPRTNKFFVVTCRVATGLPARQGVSTSNILKGLQMKAVCRLGDWEDCDVLKALLRWKCMATNLWIS